MARIMMFFGMAVGVFCEISANFVDKKDKYANIVYNNDCRTVLHWHETVHFGHCVGENYQERPGDDVEASRHRQRRWQG